ncbi:MAG: TerB family tellurite resistance protein [Chitinophagales bacterium]|nr:TerB family tellurite resistance protein [Chitinophagales bacterium]
MNQPDKLLKDYSDVEKGAYLGAIASIATADHEASDDEMEFIRALVATADLSPQQEQAVERAARDLSKEELTRCLDIIKQSDLRFSLVTDIISFAKSDGQYSEEEKQNIQSISQYLNINAKQFSLLDEFVDKSADSGKSGEEVTHPGFLESLGLNDKLSKAGINTKSLSSGLLGILGPMLVAKFLTGRMTSGGGRGIGGGLLGSGGGLLGNLMGNRGGAMGNRGMGSSMMGHGSLISLLSGGRGYGGIGSLLQNVIRK